MIDWAKEKFRQTDKKQLLLIGAGAIAATVIIGYFALRKDKNTKIPTPEPTRTQILVNQEENKQFHGAKESEEMAFIRVVNSLKKMMAEEGEGNLSYQVIKAIFKGQYILSRDEFKTLTINNRLQRRQKLDNIREYYNIVSEYQVQLESIHNKYLNNLLTHFHISQTEWIELTDQAGVQYTDDWDNFIIEIDQEEIDSLRNQQKPKLKLSTQIDIVNYKRKMLNDKVEDFRAILTDVEPADLYNVVEKWGRDMVHRTFLVEEEDINYSYKLLTEEEKDKLEPHEAELRAIMESLIIDHDEDEEEDRQSSKV